MDSDIIWVDKPGVPPFDGALLLFNVGNENYKSFPQEYLDKIQAATQKAHADNWAVLYLFDPEIGIGPAPEPFEFVESHDFIRLADKVLGVPSLKFPFLPEERLCYIRGLLLSLEDPLSQFSVKKDKFILAGQCYIGKEKVLLPLTEVVLS